MRNNLSRKQRYFDSRSIDKHYFVWLQVYAYMCLIKGLANPGRYFIYALLVTVYEIINTKSWHPNNFEPAHYRVNNHHEGESNTNM